jgi:hypothetical protein|tara:strand:- start:3115 stop:3276 length:162 start_codon:yes stop_codon:yes gene_type:complete
MEYEIMETVLVVGGVFFALPLAFMAAYGIIGTTVDLAQYAMEGVINIVTFPFT